MLQIKLSGIKYMESFAHKDPQIISLSQGSLKVGGIPKQIKEYIQQMLNTDKTDYYTNTYGIPLLREKLSATLSKKNNVAISPEQILVTHGSSGAISNIFLALLEKGDEVLLPEPTYPSYAKLAQIAQAKPVFVSCLKDSNSSEVNWEIDIEKIKKATTSKTKIITVANPSNPTGIIIPPKILNELVNWCEEKNIYLVCDEVYDDYIFDGEFQSSTKFIKKSSHVIRCGSFSKNFSMSGWRVGYLVAPQKLIPTLSAIQDTLIVCPSVIAQYAALYALDHPELTKTFKEQIHNNLILTNKMLTPLVNSGIISYKMPKSSFYLFLKNKVNDSTNLCFEIMQKSKVTIVPGESFGPSGKPFMRICYARERHILEKGLNNLLNYFENYWDK